MAFAIVQQSIDPPTLQQVRDALAKTINLNLPIVPADAPGIVRDSFGILVQKLEFPQAVALAGAFDAVGYPTQVVDEQELFDLPDARQFNRVNPTGEALVLFDIYGRAQTVAWEDIVVVACGLIGREKSIRHEEVVGHDHHGVPLYTISYEQVRSLDMVLEMLLTAEPMRVRINPHACNYSYLGPHISNRAEDNFFKLVGDIAARAKSALLNRGTKSVMAAQNTVAVYPFEKSFNEELVWTVWHATHRPVD